MPWEEENKNVRERNGMIGKSKNGNEQNDQKEVELRKENMDSKRSSTHDRGKDEQQQTQGNQSNARRSLQTLHLERRNRVARKASTRGQAFNLS